METDVNAGCCVNVPGFVTEEKGPLVGWRILSKPTSSSDLSNITNEALGLVIVDGGVTETFGTGTCCTIRRSSTESSKTFSGTTGLVADDSGRLTSWGTFRNTISSSEVSTTVNEEDVPVIADLDVGTATLDIGTR